MERTYIPFRNWKEKSKQTEYTQSTPLLSDDGKLLAKGWARHNVFDYEPVIRRIQLGDDIEVFDGLGIFSVSKGCAAPVIEHILVVLGIQVGNACQKKHTYQNKMPCNPAHTKIYFLLLTIFINFGVL